MKAAQASSSVLTSESLPMRLFLRAGEGAAIAGAAAAMAGCARGSMRVGNFVWATRGRRQAVQNKALDALSCPQGWHFTFSLLLRMPRRIAANGGETLP